MVSLTLALFAQAPATAERSYLTPAKEIAEAALAPYYKNVSPGAVSPDGTRFLVLERDGMPPLAVLAKPHVNLGGLQIDTDANRNRSLTTRNDAGLAVFDIATRKQTEIQVPKGLRIGEPKWSPDGRMIAFLADGSAWTRLFVADPSTGACKPATGRDLLPTLDTNYAWTEDGRLVAIFVPLHRGPAPTPPAVATTPHVQVTDEKGAHLETYRSLLKTPFEEAQLEYYTTGELGVADPARGSVEEVGKPAMYRTVDPSPHAKFFVVGVMQKPFSYLVPTAQFGERQTLIDAAGKELAELDKRQTRTGSPNEERARPNARRELRWRPGTDDLVYVQSVAADDEGDDGTAPATPRHDRILEWKAPFTAKDVTSLYDASGSIGTFDLAPDGKGIFLTEGAGGGRRGAGGGGFRRGAGPAAEQPRRLLYVSGPGAKPVTLFSVAPNAPEQPNLVRGFDGLPLISKDGKSTYVSGEHVYPDPYKEAPRPFVDRVALADGTKARIFESASDRFETGELLDASGDRMLVTRQSPTMVPQTFLRAGGQETQLTENRDYLPDVSQAHREELTVTRADGFKFRMHVTLPAFAHNAPCLFWIYPSEFADQAAYDRSKRSYNKNLFIAPSGASKDILVRLGYVVAEPDVPIVGPTGRMNDEYVPNLRDSLSAAIDELEAHGWIDRKRLACGGHSYGAFSTANALVHTPFFKCGIAGDGNYLRPLTPFGFQNEGRQLWEARGTYLEMSPLLYAERITGALLMYHGQEDQNVGTDPINSDRLFDILEELGKPAELVTYPYEDHGQIAKESILDQWARFTAWLAKWLK